MIHLREVNVRHGPDLGFLYHLLDERTLNQSISHKAMPSYPDHMAFVRSRPYRHWYIIEAVHPRKDTPNYPVGAIYVTYDYEIGIGIRKRHQRRGYARAAYHKINKMHGPRRWLANVNPNNAASIKFWQSLGFHHIQNTYALED